MKITDILQAIFCFYSTFDIGHNAELTTLIVTEKMYRLGYCDVTCLKDIRLRDFSRLRFDYLCFLAFLKVASGESPD